jgi:hypothetical protein
MLNQLKIFKPNILISKLSRPYINAVILNFIVQFVVQGNK